MLRIVFCWAEISSYMAACFREFSRRPGIEMHLIHPEQLFGKTNLFRSDLQLLNGISNELFRENTPGLDRSLLEAVVARRPDFVVLCGWFLQGFRKLASSPEIADAQFILGMDTPWQNTFRQRFTRLRFRSLFKRLSMVVTSGERSAEYARRIGIEENRIRTGFYGFDHKLFASVSRHNSAAPEEWPRQFIFAGRYVPQKDLATLMQGYSIYRASVSQPWGLTCCGAGIEGGRLQGMPGVVDAGFVTPGELPNIFSRHGVFVLPSRYEPWGVALAEAAASRLPIICTSACGASVELVRPYYNGIVVAPGDPVDLARAMRWMHDHEDDLPVMGQRGCALAESYSAEAWATRWHNYLLETVPAPKALDAG
jgi:glycosyltransferase involved in cell wall biosynthesis